MASRRADCVLGVALFTSSARTICDITGPCRNSNSEVCWLKMVTPVTSLGSRSGVNWMRLKVRPSERAIDFASVVFPTPGTSSIKTWPDESRAMTTSSIAPCFPTITVDTLAITRSAVD